MTTLHRVVSDPTERKPHLFSPRAGHAGLLQYRWRDGFDTSIHIREDVCGAAVAEIACNDDCNQARCGPAGE